MSVIRPVKPKPGWELIPNHFAEDVSLTEDAVSVGLWLACKPENWQVRPITIQHEFSKRPGKPRGRDWWARVARELKEGGYLRLSRTKDKGGKFASYWIFSVFGLDQLTPESGSADVGSASIGAAATGTASGGSPRASNQYSEETKHIQPPLLDRSSGDLLFEKSVQHLADRLPSWVAELDQVTAQLVVDELARALELVQTGMRKRIASPRDWVVRLVREAQTGSFKPDLALDVQKRRVAQLRGTELAAFSKPTNPETARAELQKAKHLLRGLTNA